MGVCDICCTRVGGEESKPTLGALCCLCVPKPFRFLPPVPLVHNTLGCFDAPSCTFYHPSIRSRLQRSLYSENHWGDFP